MLVLCCLLLRVVFAAVALENLDMSQLGHRGFQASLVLLTIVGRHFHEGKYLIAQLNDLKILDVSDTLSDVSLRTNPVKSMHRPSPNSRIQKASVCLNIDSLYSSIEFSYLCLSSKRVTWCEKTTKHIMPDKQVV